MTPKNLDAQNPLQEKNIHGTSPSRYSDIAEYAISSTAPNATTGIGAKREPVEDQQS